MRVIHVLRKPLSESTVAANTLKHGTGGLNIDASRISISDDLNGGASLPGDLREGASAGMFQEGGGRLPGQYVQPEGRWPANVILQHLDGCHCKGLRQVRSGGHFPAVQQSNPGAHGKMGKGWSGEVAPERHMGTDGKETVANWVCEPGCPVLHLDEDAGERRAGGTPPSRGKVCGNSIGGHGKYNAQPVVQENVRIDVPSSTGGASRFYKQVGGE